MSLAAEWAEDRLSIEYPEATYGRYSRRLMSGSSSWSQHSWKRKGNGLDIYAPGAAGSTGRTARLERIYQHLLKHRIEYNIRYLIWYRPDHYGHHIHVDFHPRGAGVPGLRWSSVETFTYLDGTTWRGKYGLAIPWNDPRVEVVDEVEMEEIRKALADLQAEVRNLLIRQRNDRAALVAIRSDVAEMREDFIEGLAAIVEALK